MFSKKFRFFDFVTEIITPENVHYGDTYSQFICGENEDVSYTVTFKFTDNLPPLDHRATEGEDVYHLNDGKKSICWYKNHGTSNIFACRCSEDCSAEVLVDSQYKNMLWDRVVFGASGFEEIAAMNNTLVLHASYIIKNDKAVLFTGPCCTGKSTQAELWQKYAHARIINGDKALITYKDGKALAGGLPFSGSSDYCENTVCEIAAIVCPGKAKENSLSLLGRKTAVFELLKNCYRPMHNGMTDSALALLSSISNSVPVYRLDCIPDQSAVEILENELCF